MIEGHSEEGDTYVKPDVGISLSETLFSVLWDCHSPKHICSGLRNDDLNT